MSGQIVSPQMLRRISLFTLELKLDDFIRVLERHYNPNWPAEPRVPGGEPIGSGQWTSGTGAEGGSIGNSSRPSKRVAVELTPMGTLHSQIRLRDGSLLCVYNFGLQHWMIPSASKVIGCPALMSQSIFGYGVRLNDNY
jgi:hypothetical protein